MQYTFDFSSLWEYREYIIRGILGTLRLTAIGTIFGVMVGTLGAVSRAWRLPGLLQFYSVYVELIRNTPFIVQLFFIFFGLPAMGVRINEWTAAELAMVINVGAYSTEIIRAGVMATPRGQIEAGLSLAMSRTQIFFHIVLRPALQRVWPALTSQVVAVMLGSAVCSQIAAEELSFGANFIQSRTFRAFETYMFVTLVYLIMSIVVRHLITLFGRHVVIGRPK